MSRIHFIGGEKGGVGKSVMARLLCQYFIDLDIGFTGIDADQSHGALLRYYSDYSKPVNLEVFEEADQVMDTAISTEQRVVVDLPAQSSSVVHRWMKASDLANFARESNVPLVFWHVSDGGFDSITLLDRHLKTMAELEDHSQTVLVRNWGRSSNFSQFEESDTRRALDAQGGRVIDLTALDPDSMYRIDRFGSSMWAAVNSQQTGLALTPMGRRRVGTWLRQCYQEIERLGEIV